ncbi:uncharacterized protein LOC111384598, partial [Olea europaea var. sylvestris]|uniref:uncharacterized protein LOC111384598 n=1 Tax=Olea europaea var. sylvestris TaxID=158386 RepID=UPI000C1D0E64
PYHTKNQPRSFFPRPHPSINFLPINSQLSPFFILLPRTPQNCLLFSLPSLAKLVCQIILPGFGFVNNKAKTMNGCVYQQNSLVGCVGDMAKKGDSDGVVCPKPRRVGLPLRFDEPIRSPSRLLHITNEPSEACDAKAGTELLDIILMKVFLFLIDGVVEASQI